MNRVQGLLRYGVVLVCSSALATTDSGLFFEDFHTSQLAELTAHGWTVRSAQGHPGIAGAQWGPDSVGLVAASDPKAPATKHWLRLQARTDGRAEHTVQAQICHQRKFFEGTTAARVRLSDAPVQGADGDVVVQAFYLVSPLRFDFDPEFSEVDWEYLPNGGWGDDRTRLYGITWQTARLEPWSAYNQAHQEFRSLNGWHTLIVQVQGGRTRHILDGVTLAEHGGRNYPVVPMALNFNQWFSPGGLLPVSDQARIYTLDVDWVFHVQGKVLGPEDVAQQVQALRSAQVPFVDTVGAATPPLASPCNF